MRGLRSRLTIFAGLMAAALSGCAEIQNRTAIIGSADYSTLYNPGMVSYSALSGEIATVVRGDPFGHGDTPDQAEAIANQLVSPGWLGARRFTTLPHPETRSNYKVVLIFNPARLNTGDDQTCARPNEEPTLGRAAGASTFTAVFCADVRWASRLSGTIPLASGPDSPAFRDALNIALSELLPSRNPVVEPGGFEGVFTR